MIRELFVLEVILESRVRIFDDVLVRLLGWHAGGDQTMLRLIPIVGLQDKVRRVLEHAGEGVPFFLRVIPEALVDRHELPDLAANVFREILRDLLYSHRPKVATFLVKY